MSYSKERTKKQLQSAFSIVETFQSPLLLSNLSIPIELDREIVRSIALFGDTDCLKDTIRRNPAFVSLDTTTKKAARNRRRYLLATKHQQPEKFEQFCAHYSVPFLIPKKDLSTEFDIVSNHHPESTKKTMAMVPISKQLGKY